MVAANSTAAGGGAAAASRQDDELTDLLTKLYTIQEDIGAKPPSSEEEKREKASNIALMGKGKKAAAKGSRFLELKSMIVDRLKTIHVLLKETKSKEAAGYGGDNAKEIIKLQAEIREHIRQCNEEWNEMDAIYKKEIRKKKSKFTIEELEIQSELVRRLAIEMEKTKEAQMRGYSKNRDPSSAVTLNTKALYADTTTASGTFV
jgi:dTDP-D-glucose 4,6-dehydratase